MTTATEPRRNSPARAATAAMVGSTLEYYDNFIYALASALVFGQVFFPDAGAVSTLASLSTFAISYVARPLGAIIMGHFGDRIGRKKVLVAILIMMGTCTFLVGCLPGYDMIGILAPTLLVTLRILQGISIGGETAAAATLTIEVAPEGRRGFFTSFGPNGIVAGFVLSPLVFLPVSAMGDDDLHAWGWRVPFLLSVFVTIAGFIIRATLAEPEAFEAAKERDDLVKVPIALVFSRYWRDIVRIVLCSLAFSFDTVIKVYALSMASDVYGIPSSTMLWVMVVTNLIALGTQPYFGALSDRIGRRPVFIAGNVVTVLAISSFFLSIQLGSIPLLFITGTVAVAIGYGLINCCYPAMYAEMFSLRVRQSGMAFGQQIGLIAAGFAPMVYAALTAGDPGNWVPVAACCAVIAVISIVATLAGRETAKVPLAELGTYRMHEATTSASEAR